MRLIDADKLERQEYWGNERCFDYVDAEDIDNAPTVDAVEVVRCKDCKYAGTKRESVAEKRYVADILFCRNSDLCGDEPLAMWPDDFCSYGEPKEG